MGLGAGGALLPLVWNRFCCAKQRVVFPEASMAGRVVRRVVGSGGDGMEVHVPPTREGVEWETRGLGEGKTVDVLSLTLSVLRVTVDPVSWSAGGIIVRPVP